MNSGASGRRLIPKGSSRTFGITVTVITVLVFSGADDLRVAVVTHRCGSTMIWLVATYVFTTVALLCWQRPALQELLLLVGLVSSVAAEKVAFSIPLLVVLAFFASQHGLRRHFIPIIIGAAVVMTRATAHELSLIHISEPTRH